MSVKIEIKPKKSRTFLESESYKKLRTNIQFSGKNMKVIALTSTMPNEGKTEVAFRLAWSLSEMGKKTLFIDADLRNSTFLARHDVHHELKGLAHYLVGENSLEEIITETQNPMLDIIAIGAFPPNPSELLSQDIYKELIAELRERYDYVILDTPPAGLVIDGVIASAAADGSILVIHSGKITQKAAKMTISELEKANCKIIGCVLNKCGEGGKSNMGYGYGYGYGGYGGYNYGGYGHSKEFDVKSKFGFIDKLKKKLKK